MSARDVLDRWQALADGATEGPWEREAWSLGETLNDARGISLIHDADGAVPCLDQNNAEFIAAARTIVPAAVKALRDVLDELDEWERAGHLSIEMVHIRRAIEAAIGGEGS